MMVRLLLYAAALILAACGSAEPPYDADLVTDIHGGLVEVVSGEVGDPSTFDADVDGQLCRGYDGSADDVSEKLRSVWDLGTDFDKGIALVEEVGSHLVGLSGEESVERWQVGDAAIGVTASGAGFNVGAWATRSVEGQVVFAVSTNGQCF